MGTIVWMDGFDDYDPVTQATTIGGWSQNFGAFAGYGNGSWNRRYVTGTQWTGSHSVPSDSQYSVAFYWYCPTTSITALPRFKEGTTIHGTLSYSATTNLLTLGSTTSSIALVPNTWYHIEVDYKVADLPNGSYTVKVNGDTHITASGVDTKNGLTGVIDNIEWSSASGQTVYLDDIVAMKGGGTIGICRIVTQFSNAAGTNNDWDVTAGDTTADWQATGTGSGGSTNSSPTWPTHQADDVAILIVETGGSEPVATAPPNSTWTLVEGTPIETGATTSASRLTAYWARAYSASMPLVALGDSGDHSWAAIITFRGCAKTGSPIDAVVVGTSLSSSSAVATGVTTSTNNSPVLVAATWDTDSAGPLVSNWSNSTVTLTERYDAGTADGTGGGFGIATGVLATAGSTNNTTVNFSQSLSSCWITIALKPSSSDAYNAVNDTFHNTDQDYISTATTGERDTFGFPDLGVAGTVKAVGVKYTARKDDGEIRKTTSVVRSGSTNYDDSTLDTLGTSYGAYLHIYEQDPATSSGWTVSGLDAAEFGVKLDT